MGLLYPFALLTALAAIGPLILHFWRREQQVPPNLFPGVFFLVDPATPRPVRARPLTWLLTLCRTALILLLALLAAGPYFDSHAEQPLPEHPVLLGIVVDDSPSMGLAADATTTETRLQQGLAEANKLIDGLPPGSGVVWTTTSGKFHALTLKPGAELPVATPLRIDCEPSDAAGDIGRALDRIAQAAQEIPLPQRAVAVISDRTIGLDGPNVREHVQTGLAKLAAARIPLLLLNAPTGSAAAVDAPSHPPLLKIVAIERPASWRTGRPVTISVQVLFDAERAGDAAAAASGEIGGVGAPAARRVRTLTWLLGEERQEQVDPAPVASVDLPCGLRLQRFELVHRFAEAGWWKIEVAAEIDERRQDRRVTFFSLRGPTPVWLVEPEDAADSRYLALAIDPLRQGGGATGAPGDPVPDEPTGSGAEWVLLRKTSADLRQGLPENGVLVLWGAGRDLSGADWDAIQAAAMRGMGVWWVGDGGPLPGSREHGMLFWSTDRAASGGQLPVQLAQRARLGLVPIRGLPENSIREALAATGAAVFDPAGIDRFYAVRPVDGAGVPLLAVVAGRDQLNPALLESALGRGMGLLWTVPPVKSNGGLVDAALWPLIASLVLERAAPATGEWQDALVGGPLALQVGAGAEPPFRLERFPAHGVLPARWPPVEDGTAWHARLAGAAAESRPVRHFFRDGRFHLMGSSAGTCAVEVLSDRHGRVWGAQAVGIPAAEWDSTRVDEDFFGLAAGGLALPGPATGTDGAAGRGGALMPVEAASAAEALAELQRLEQDGRAGGGAVSGPGDATPYFLAVLLGMLGVWLYLERREYSIAG